MNGASCSVRETPPRIRMAGTQVVDKGQKDVQRRQVRDVQKVRKKDEVASMR
jgi:hypothetical protein